MIEKIGHVKNPLTIIAIFAGLAEVSGTIVLPFMELSVQRIFVYFLMIFPTVLIVGFFVLLWCKHDVLYAPSDFRSDEPFTDIIKQRTVQEKFSQEAEDLSLDAGVKNAESKEGDKKYQDPPALENKDSADLDAKHPISQRRNRILEAYAAEQAAVELLTRQMNIKFESNISFGKSSRIVDAVSINKDRVVLVEAKYLTRPEYAHRRIREIVEHLRSAYKSMPAALRDKAEGIGVLMVDGYDEAKRVAPEILKSFEEYSSGAEMPMAIKIFGMDKSENIVRDVLESHNLISQHFFKSTTPS